MTLYPYNTITMAASVAQQLVSVMGGPHTYVIINLGTGNLYVRQDAAPTGATDPQAMKIPSTITVPIAFPVYNGKSGLWVLADAAGSISVADQGIR
jgi:hypothetical protein